MASGGTVTVKAILDTKGFKSGVSGMNSELSKVGSDAPSLGDKAGAAFGEAMKIATMLKIAAIGAAIGAALKGIISEYADYEQLIGGVETLFGDSAGIVEQNAANAFKTAGLSANEYMENVTGFSASLLQSLGGDTDAAAKMADVAMTDMSDNANKMGTSMDRITDAYQGFAKQNYTMLDNLKLGYGGTKEEMQRLLSDAEELTGKKFDIDNFSDVVEAIHAIQEEMDITGTTMEEAEHTISGSLNMLKASWSNWLVGLAADDADIDALTEQLIDSVITFAENAIPRIIQVVQSLFQKVPQAIAEAIDELTLPLAFKYDFGEFWDNVQPLIDAVINFKDVIEQDLKSAIDTVKPTIEDLMPYAQEFAYSILPTLTGLIDYLAGLISMLGTAFQILWDTLEAAGVFDDIKFHLQTLSEGFRLLGMVLSAVGGSFQDAATQAQNAWNTAKETISGAIDTVKQKFDSMSSIVGTVSGIFSSIHSTISSKIESARSAVHSAIDSIRSKFSIFPIHLGNICTLNLPHISVNGGSAPWGIGGKGTKPSFSVSWYAKGGVFNSPSLIGVGEAGAEAVLPLNSRTYGEIAKGIVSQGGGGQVINVYINDAIVNSDKDIQRALYSLVGEIKRKGYIK